MDKISWADYVKLVGMASSSGMYASAARGLVKAGDAVARLVTSPRAVKRLSDIRKGLELRLGELAPMINTAYDRFAERLVIDVYVKPEAIATMFGTDSGAFGLCETTLRGTLQSFIRHTRSITGVATPLGLRRPVTASEYQYMYLYEAYEIQGNPVVAVRYRFTLNGFKLNEKEK